MRQIGHIDEAFQILDNNKKVAADNNNQQQPANNNNPLTAKINLNKMMNQQAPPPNNSDTTGISITNGSYLNMNNGKNGANNEPTWKKVEN